MNWVMFGLGALTGGAVAVISVWLAVRGRDWRTF